MEDLFQGRILVHSTVDERVQTIVNEALENGLALYEERHPDAQGVIQGSVVVLRNADAAILAEAGGRQIYKDRHTRYSDLNRATGSLRQPGSAWKPLVYLAAFRQDLDLDTTVPDQPISVAMGANRPVKWISNYDHRFKGPIPMRQALAESRNAVAVWITRKIGVDEVITTSQEFGIRTPLQPYIATALGASEVRLLELAGAYRAMASGILAEPHIIDRVTDASGEVLYEAFPSTLEGESTGLSLVQEGLRGVGRLPGGTAHAAAGRACLISVMGTSGVRSGARAAPARRAHRPRGSARSRRGRSRGIRGAAPHAEASACSSDGGSRPACTHAARRAGGRRCESRCRLDERAVSGGSPRPERDRAFPGSTPAKSQSSTTRRAPGHLARRRPSAAACPRECTSGRRHSLRSRCGGLRPA